MPSVGCHPVNDALSILMRQPATGDRGHGNRRDRGRWRCRQIVGDLRRHQRDATLTNVSILGVTNEWARTRRIRPNVSWSV
jgi:hypothetical protein